MYRYVHTTDPLHRGAGVDPTRTAFTVLPHASNIAAGAPGSTASPGHDTVALPFGGAVKPPE